MGQGHKGPPETAVVGADGKVIEAGIEWDSAAAKDIHDRLWDHINRHTDAIMSGAGSAAEIPGRELRALAETAEARRQADVIYKKHTRPYVRVRDGSAGS